MVFITSPTKFPLGRLVATPGVLRVVPNAEIDAAIDRHAHGDWGVISKNDKKQNDQALTDGGRLFSAYRAAGGTKFWIITEADRSATTVLLPSEY